MLTALDLNNRLDAMRLDAPVPAPRLQLVSSPSAERLAARAAWKAVPRMEDDEFESMWEDGLGSW